ncbi:MAG: GxxExxY protein [Candidatus Sungbacteria bacterium]|nr:GxxExxY protein [Candidatus Sungbacteria bacterium]
MGKEIIYPELLYELVGVLFAVHNELGRFRTERQYGDAIEKYLKEFHISFDREKILPTSFDGERSGHNKIDFIVDDKILLEIKAKRFITKDDYLQIKRYLVASRKRLAILVNFHRRYLSPQRIVLGYS